MIRNKFYKIIFIMALVIPGFSYCQTVHVEKGRIAYKGSEKIDQLTKDELFKKVKIALLKNVHGHNHQFIIDDEKNGELAMNGEIKLTSSFNFLRVLQYSINVSVKKGVYKYSIDSVFVRVNERHVKTTDISSEELLKGMEISGNVASNTEKQLNEIDMDFQKLLDLIHNDIAEADIKSAQSKK